MSIKLANPSKLRSNDVIVDVPADSLPKIPVKSDVSIDEKVDSTKPLSQKESKLNDLKLYERYQKVKVNSQAETIDLKTRAEDLSKILVGAERVGYDKVKPYINGLNASDAKALRGVYQQNTGRDLLIDLNKLTMEDKFAAFKILAPERIKIQSEPQEKGIGINMNPPAKEVPFGSTIQYSLNLSNEIGAKKISHLVRGEHANIKESGQSFEAFFPETQDGKPENRLILFEVEYAGKPSEFYKYTQTAVSANSKAENELSKMPGVAPESDLYQQFIDLRIDEAKQLLTELKERKASVENEIQNGPTRTTDGSRNSSDVYSDLRKVNQQIEQLTAEITNLETSKTEMAKAFGDSVGKPIPLKAVLLAKENGQTIPLQLYAKYMGGGKWAIIDATNAAKPRSYIGEGMLPTDALNQAWGKFVNGTNDLPAGQIAVSKPKGLGITNENTAWNAQSAGKSTLKQFADGLGKGSLALAGLGIGALLIPGGQGIGVALLFGSGVTGGVSAAANMADRNNSGTLKADAETAFDMLGIVGGLASVGGISAFAGAGSKGLSILANGAKFHISKTRCFHANCPSYRARDKYRRRNFDFKLNSFCNGKGKQKRHEPGPKIICNS